MVFASDIATISAAALFLCEPFGMLHWALLDDRFTNAHTLKRMLLYVVQILVIITIASIYFKFVRNISLVG